ncbi:MAG: hypothetical protein GWO38_16260 [Phycisphaerae bacterium]|nr:hypothetical protein [Phycisphaerae bacterium]NIW95422.1 hypothetical protein [Phycisphaerae bacterium]NIX29135.1 hypothetical protein [Phycisphaerae bacterium]
MNRQTSQIIAQVAKPPATALPTAANANNPINCSFGMLIQRLSRASLKFFRQELTASALLLK